jgi:hypothetical protein
VYRESSRLEFFLIAIVYRPINKRYQYLHGEKNEHLGSCERLLHIKPGLFICMCVCGKTISHGAHIGAHSVVCSKLGGYANRVTENCDNLFDFRMNSHNTIYRIQCRLSFHIGW